MGARRELESQNFPSCLKKTLLGGFQEGSSEPTAVVSGRLEDEVQVCSLACDLPGRLQLLRNLKHDQEEDEEAEEDPESTWLAPVYCFQLPARRQTLQASRRKGKCEAEGKGALRLFNCIAFRGEVAFPWVARAHRQ